MIIISILIPYGKNISGRNVEATGPEPEALLDECKRFAKRMINDQKEYENKGQIF